MAGNKKYNDILESTRELFFRYGIKRVTVEEICNNAKVSKMTFYKYFPNKLELAKVVIDGLFTYWTDRYFSIEKMDLSFDKKMEMIIDLKQQAAKDLSSSFYQEIFDTPYQELTQMAYDWLHKALDYTYDFFKRAQDNGEITSNLKIRLLMAIQENLSELLKNRELMSEYTSMSEFVRELTEFYLYGIMPRR